MKRFFLTIFFAFYHMFMPFVLLNCSSSDLPYVTQANADESVDDAAKLEACNEQSFLTEDCVEVVQAASEAEDAAAEAVLTAYDALSDFIQCETTSIATADAEEDADAIDCEQVVADVLDGFDACQEGSVSGKDYSCGEIEDTVSSAATSCDAGDESVTADFCGILG